VDFTYFSPKPPRNMEVEETVLRAIPTILVRELLWDATGIFYLRLA